jgi:hypothetical protein
VVIVPGQDTTRVDARQFRQVQANRSNSCPIGILIPDRILFYLVFDIRDISGSMLLQRVFQDIFHYSMDAKDLE